MAIDTLRLTGAGERLAPLAVRFAFFIVVLAAVPMLYAQPLWIFAATLTLVTALAMIVDKTLAIPIVIIAIPLEISKEMLPSIYDDPSTPRIQESILDAGRLSIMAAAALWVAQARSNWFEELPRSSLYLPLILMAGLFLLSITYSQDPRGAARDTVRLISNLGLFALVLIYVRDRITLDRAVLALVGSGLLLALLGLYQQATDTYFINEGLANLDVPRRNATFFDPNIYARFILVVAALALAMSSVARSWRLLLMTATFAAAILVLPFTSSRSNWIAAAVVLPTVIALLPIATGKKIRLLAIGAIAAAVLMLIATQVEPALVDRLKSISSETESMGSRTYLLRAGWQMFVDNPLFGVGLNGYREALEGPYSYLLPPNATTFLSHTTVVTVTAELGLLGLGVLGLLLFRFWRLSWRLYRGGSTADQTLVAGLVGGLLVIFVSSQAEGRFFEEPYLWLLLGLAVALANIRRLEVENDTTRQARPDE